MKIFIWLLAFGLALFQCSSTEKTRIPELDYDPDYQELQTELESRRHQFYTLPNPPTFIDHSIEIPESFLFRFQEPPTDIVFRLDVAENGSFRRTVVRGGPPEYIKLCNRVLNRVRFRPAWIGPHNYDAGLLVRFRFRSSARETDIALKNPTEN